MRKNSGFFGSSLRKDLAAILFFSAFAPIAVASALLFLHLEKEVEVRKAAHEQFERRLAYNVASFLKSVSSSTHAVSQSSELIDYVMAPSELRHFSSNRLYGRLLEFKESFQEEISWRVLDARGHVIFTSASSPERRPIAPLTDGFVVSRHYGMVTYTKVLRYDDQQLQGPMAPIAGYLLADVALGDVEKSLPEGYRLADLPEGSGADQLAFASNGKSQGPGKEITLKIAFVSLILVLTTIIGLVLIQRRILRPIERLADSVISKAQGVAIPREKNEIKFLEKAFSAYTSYIYRVQSDLAKQSELAALANQASQVAHDIRSPLSALTVAESHLHSVPEDVRLLVRASITRIRDIANDLMGRKLQNTAARDPAGRTVELLSTVVSVIATEKRIQYRARPGISIEEITSPSSYGTFASVQADVLKRVLSNLINNAVDAFEDEHGHVTVTVMSDAKWAMIEVRDNGKGIPPEVLPRLTERGFTHGKADGHGLGLHHAKTAVESWGGVLQIQSVLGLGTTVLVKVPRHEPPAWFVPRLMLAPGQNVAIVDDDDTIQSVWRKRLLPMNGASLGARIKCFSRPAAFSAFHRALGDEENCLLLVDYEFIGESRSGLDLIEELNLGARSILVTSRFDEANVRERCLALGVKMIPKTAVADVPIAWSQTEVTGVETVSI